MKQKNIRLKIIVVIAIAIIFTFIFSSCNVFNLNNIYTKTDNTSANNASTEKEIFSEETTIKEIGSEDKETIQEEQSSEELTKQSSEELLKDLIKVTKPLPYELVESPLIVKGEARGTWFFEGNFPIMLLDENRNPVARHFATAKGEWMTEDFVPFEAVIEFKKPSTTTGFLVLEKDNPSGLPENDAKIEIPIKFKD